MADAQIGQSGNSGELTRLYGAVLVGRPENDSQSHIAAPSRSFPVYRLRPDFERIALAAAATAAGTGAFTAGLLLGRTLSTRQLRRSLVLGTMILAGCLIGSVAVVLMRNRLRATMSSARRQLGRASKLGHIVVANSDLQAVTMLVAGKNYWWQPNICARPVALFTSFEPAATEEEFFASNFLASEPLCVELELAPQSRGIDASYLAAMAIYTSGAVRSVPADIHVQGRTVEVLIRDRLFLVDPNAAVPDSLINGVSDKVTLFVVNCEEA